MSGFLSASAALTIGRLRNGFLAGLVIGSASALGFMTGGMGVGTVISAALLVGCFTPTLRFVLRREDDCFFGLSVLFWVLLLLTGGFLCLMGDPMNTDILAVWETLTASTSELAGKLEDLNGGEGVAEWLRSNPLANTLVFMLPLQALVAFLALRWSRVKLNWIDPIYGELVFFRLHIRYSLLVIASMSLMAMGLTAEKDWMMAMGLPLMTWVASGCFLAGFAIMRFMAMRFQLLGKAVTARMIIIAALLMVFFAIEFLAMIGLIDIWFDIRKLTLIRKGEK